MTKTLTKEQWSKLLAIVKEYPIIYDIKDPNYKEMNYLKFAWSEISSRMNLKGLFIILINLSFFFINNLYFFRHKSSEKVWRFSVSSS